MSIVISKFGALPDGRRVLCYTMENKNGICAKILNFGGVLQSLWIPDRNGKKTDIVLGYDSIDGYLTNDASLGAIVGRLVGPVPGCILEFNGRKVRLPSNTPDGGHCHGGKTGFSRSLWTSGAYSDPGCDKVELTLLSKDGDDGYPGNVRVKLIYTLNDENELSLEYSAEADEDTPLNPTSHCYFNLSGNHSGVIDDQMISVSNYAVSIGPKMVPVEGTILDLNELSTFGSKFYSGDPLTANGLDNFHLLKGEGFRKVMYAKSDKTGCVMEVYTDAPAAIVYTGNWLNNLVGKGNKPYNKHDGFCFETCYVEKNENFNPSKVRLVGPGKPFAKHTSYSFSIG